MNETKKLEMNESYHKFNDNHCMEQDLKVRESEKLDSLDKQNGKPLL